MTQLITSNIANSDVTIMRYDRGITKHLVSPKNGAVNIDCHINVINSDSGLGPYHYHDKSENIYLVLEGTAHAVIDGKFYEFNKGDVAYIPPGVPHAAGSNGVDEATVLEIYAPPGPDFHIISEQPPDVAPNRGADTGKS